MEKKKLFKVILGGVVSSFVLSGCHTSDEEIKINKTDVVLEESSFLEQDKLERDKIIKELDTAKKVKVYAYNGEEVETFVNKDSEDLILMIAYYDAMETKLYGKQVKNYQGDEITTLYYNLNYRAIMNAFHKKAGDHPTQAKLREVYDELVNEWNLWNLSYCTEEVQQEIALKMVDMQNKKYPNHTFEYVNPMVTYEDCKYQDTIVKVPVYYFSMKASQKNKHEVIKDSIISVLPDPDLVREAKKVYYQEHEKSMVNLGVYHRTGMSENERYILLKQYYDIVPGTNYKYLFFILQCQILTDGEWMDYGQITINQDLFQSFERIGEISFPSLYNENIERIFNMNDAISSVNPMSEEGEVLQEEQSSYHR